MSILMNCHGRRAPAKQRQSRLPVRARWQTSQNKQAIRERIVKAALGLFQNQGLRRYNDEKSSPVKLRSRRVRSLTTLRPRKILPSISSNRKLTTPSPPSRQPAFAKSALEKLFTLVHSQLEYLAPYERFIGAALIHALNPASHLGPFGHCAQELRHRYLALVAELMEESIAETETGPTLLACTRSLLDLTTLVCVVLALRFVEDKQNTVAFLDRSQTLAFLC